MKKVFILILVLFFTIYKSEGQEIGLTGFYQADLLFSPRPGATINFKKEINNIFSVDFEYGNQYIKEAYHTGSFDYSETIEAKDYIHNLGVSFLISVYNSNRVNIQIGSKYSAFLITGKENVTALTYMPTSDTTFSVTEKKYVNYPFDFYYYSYSNELRFKIKKVLIPNISVNFNLSSGFIFHGTHQSGCVIMLPDIFAPYGRFGIGLSYRFIKKN